VQDGAGGKAPTEGRKERGRKSSGDILGRKIKYAGKGDTSKSTMGMTGVFLLVGGNTCCLEKNAKAKEEGGAENFNSEPTRRKGRPGATASIVRIRRPKGNS